MEFYTSAISDKTAEQCFSTRSLSSSINGGSSRFNLTSRSYGTSKASVRHVNSAAFIENKLQEVSSDDNVSCAITGDNHSNIVPPLDLRSEENFPTRDYTFSYRKHCEESEIALKPDKAYETWLSAKKKLISDEATRRRKAMEIKQREIEDRQRLANEQYKKWLEKKSQTFITTQCDKSNANLDIRSRPKLTAEEARARLEEWERTKRLEEQRRRRLKTEEQQRRCELEEQRRQMAVGAWKNWIADADKKPKPVPLNRGIFTLRGTISDIFVNPNEWKPIVPINNEDN